MSENGYNLAIFDENHFKCTEVTVYDIKKLEYKFDKVLSIL